MKKGIEIENVSVSYEAGTYQLRDINLNIPSGSFFGITGVNGSGKTTLTQILNGIIPNEIDTDFTGQVLVDGESTRAHTVSDFSRKVGIVFQNPDFMLFNLTVGEEIAFGLKHLKSSAIKSRISKSLQQVGLEGFEDRDPQTLSLGQKQKICLACVLAREPDYIVLDEPTAMLDFKSSLKIFEILQKLNRMGRTIIVVEHDTEFLLKYATQMIVLDNGSILMQGKPGKIFSEKKILNKIGIKIPGAML